MREEEEKELVTNTSTMIDVAFNIECKTLPYDHAYDLSKAITTILPWMNENKFSGIHTLHVPDSGNGWVRSEDDEIFLSKRTRLILRIPRKHIDDAKQLEGKKINILKAKYIKTQKNEQVKEFYDRCLFDLIDRNDSVRNYALDLSNYEAKKIWKTRF